MAAPTTGVHFDPFEQCVVRARELAASGHQRDALGALLEANRLQRSPELDRELVQLRLAAFDTLEEGSAPVEWPPRVQDPFPDVSGALPEIGRHEMTTEVVAGGVLHHGAVVVRNLVESAAVPSMVASIDDAFADEGTGDGAFVPFDGGDDEGMARRRAWVRTNETIWAADAPGTMFDVLEVLHRLEVRSLLQAHFGEPPALSVHKFTFRRVPPTGLAAWHQDGTFLGEGVRSMNLWISLSPCGGDASDAPALALVPRRIDELIEPDNVPIVNGLRPSTVKARFGDDIVVPRFEAGDALWFDERFLHTTYRAKGMSKARHAIETWFFAPSRFPPSYLGLAF